MSRDDATADRGGETAGRTTDAAETPSDATRERESVQSQLDVLTLLVAVVGVGHLVGGVVATFAALFAVGVGVLALYRIYRRENGS